jgi:hypothetical protein
MRKLAFGLILVLAVVTAASTSAAGSSLLPACAYGSSPAGLIGYEESAITQAAGAYSGDRSAFAAAAAAYVYGYPMIDELATLKGYVHNTLINVDALATPSTQGVVSPNVDTAYSVAWIDLTQGPLVFTVPAMANRFYTVQFMDAFTNAFAYVGYGTTGPAAGSYALVPPGWSGALPAGVHEIQAPTNTLWLLGRTRVNSTADLAAVKAAQAGYTLTPLAAYEAGVREPGLSLDKYPNGKAKAIPTGAKFIGALNQELTFNPPPAADDCLVAALAPAGVSLSQPSSSQSLSADLENVAGVTPAPADNPAVDAGLAAGKQIVAAAATKVEASLAAADHGWEILTSGIGVYGTDDIARAIIATDFLGANTPVQGLYPMADVDVDDRPLDGANTYTITFPKGDLPPAGAFWSLTMYGSDNYLYANSLDRYAVGNRTTGLVDNPNGSLTLYLSHSQPTTGTSTWLPAPAGNFHVILRLYQPARSALDGAWRPPPIFAAGERLVPVISRVRRSGRKLSWTDSQATRTHLRLVGPGGLTVQLEHRDRAGRNTVTLSLQRHGRVLAGAYRVYLRPARALYDTGAGQIARYGFRV